MITDEFFLWEIEVNRIIFEALGVSADDLPNATLNEDFENGMTPLESALASVEERFKGMIKQ